jgi:enoyl-CoA hydratase/carnithine racemase
MRTDYHDIRVEIRGRVGIVSLAKPERGNTLSEKNTIDELEQAIKELDLSGEISVAIVTGEERIFSAGGNIKAMRDRTGMFSGDTHMIYAQYATSVQRVTRLMKESGLVTLAAVNGAAIGAGCDLALMCDLRIAAQSATFSQAFVNLGIIPGDGGVWFLTRTVPRHIAADLIFSGRSIAAEEALRIGIVNEVVEDSMLMTRALELASVIASKPPLALRLSKQLLDRAYATPLPDFLDVCAAYQAMLHHTQDHTEALQAFFEKRTGTYHGR